MPTPNHILNFFSMLSPEQLKELAKMAAPGQLNEMAEEFHEIMDTFLGPRKKDTQE